MKRLWQVQMLLAIFLLALLASSEVRVARADDPGAMTIPVVFLPGIGGTRLADSENVEYWTAAGYSGHDLLTLYPSQLHPTLYPTNAITEATFLGFHIPSEDWQTYGPILNYFQAQGFVPYNTYQNPNYQTSAGCDLTQASNNPNLFVFAYDWRISNADNATKLADYIACVQQFYPDTNVNLVAHSMGGLVARRYLINNPATHHVNAFVSVGSPYLGAGKLVWVEETGKFIFFVWASTLFDIIGSFNGASELMNSQAWYDMGGAPALVENGQDLNNNGKTNEKFSYPMLVQYMNTAKGKEGFLPGTQNQNFHSYTNGSNSQDDWRNDTTGVKYFHIVGAGLVPDTINQVVAASFWKCVQNYSICDLSTWMYPKFAQGDQTVPLLSSSRISGTLSYNAPNATVYECQAFGANNQNVDHTGMLSNPVVQNLLLEYLTQANGGANANPPPSLQCGQGQNLLTPDAAEGKYHRVEISGAKEIQVHDESADPFPDGALQYAMNNNSELLVLSSGKLYTISFRTTNDPLYLEWEYRDGKRVRRAIRYQDITLAQGTRAEITLNDGVITDLHYDTDGDDTVDATISPLVSLVGAAARDARPPRLKFSSQAQGARKRVELRAIDKASGVAAVVYSLDAKHFQVYTGPFEVNATIKKIYAFAQDFAGNRSPAKTFRVK